MILTEYWDVVVFFALFALLHSVCAREPFKELLARVAGRYFVEHFWRVTYCALSYGALYHGISVLLWSRHLDQNIWVFNYPEWLWQILVLLHLVSIALAYVAFLQSDYLEFLGIKQARRGILVLLGRAPPHSITLFGTHRLEIKGVYAWVRHPMLAAGLLFLLTSGPSLNNMIFLALYTAYMLIGGYYEEKRMVRIFGSQYLLYRKRVGAFFPKLPIPS